VVETRQGTLGLHRTSHRGEGDPVGCLVDLSQPTTPKAFIPIDQRMYRGMRIRRDQLICRKGRGRWFWRLLIRRDPILRRPVGFRGLRIHWDRRRFRGLVMFHGSSRTERVRLHISGLVILRDLVRRSLVGLRQADRVVLRQIDRPVRNVG